MSRAEVKKNKKLIKAKIKNGEELEEHEQDWADEWNIDFKRNGVPNKQFQYT